jgi:regulator of protease activity HflC (stomatin/prohibitin superfamily)
MNGLEFDRLLDWLVVIGWTWTLWLMARAFYRSLREHGIRQTFTLKRGGWILSRRVVLSVMTSVAITLIAMAVVFVPPQQNAVVISALSPEGLRPNTLDAGLHGVVPFLERAKGYPIYNQTFSISKSGFERGESGVDDTISARSKEGQEVLMDATLIYRIDPGRLNEVHILWQDRYLENLVRPLVRGFVRGRAAKLTVEEIYSSQRFEMEQAIFDDISAVLADNGFLGQEFILRNISFNPDYAAAVEAKVITEQEALRAEIAVSTKKNQAEQIRTLAQGEADAVVIKAQADADALRLINQVLEENPRVLDWEYIKRLAPNVSLMLLNSDNPVILPLTTEMTGGAAATTNPLIPQMPPSGLSPDGTPMEPQMPPSGLAGDGVIEELASPPSEPSPEGPVTSSTGVEVAPAPTATPEESGGTN